jgi:hypothetical protein
MVKLDGARDPTPLGEMDLSDHPHIDAMRLRHRALPKRGAPSAKPMLGTLEIPKAHCDSASKRALIRECANDRAVRILTKSSH